jgi:hypothetical protein
MSMRHIAALVLAVFVLSAASLQAQTIGTFSWRLSPYGSVLTLTVTQRGGVYELIGFESQCGGNLSLPASGVAVPQANGTIFFGLTSINERGGGLHTRGFITLPTLSGTWSDNAGNTNQPFLPTVPASPNCVGGPRTDPLSGDAPVPEP